MAINKVEVQKSDGTMETLIDLTADNVTREDVSYGVTYHGPNGIRSSGSMRYYTPFDSFGFIYNSLISVELSESSYRNSEPVMNIKYANTSGKKWFSNDHPIPIVMESSIFGDALPRDVMLGKTFTSSSGLKVEGTAAVMYDLVYWDEEHEACASNYTVSEINSILAEYGDSVFLIFGRKAELMSSMGDPESIFKTFVIDVDDDYNVYGSYINQFKIYNNKTVDETSTFTPLIHQVIWPFYDGDDGLMSTTSPSYLYELVDRYDAIITADGVLKSSSASYNEDLDEATIYFDLVEDGDGYIISFVYTVNSDKTVTTTLVELDYVVTSEDTVTAEDLVSGVTAHDANGEQIIGTMTSIDYLYADVEKAYWDGPNRGRVTIDVTSGSTAQYIPKEHTYKVILGSSSCLGNCWADSVLVGSTFSSNAGIQVKGTLELPRTFYGINDFSTEANASVTNYTVTISDTTENSIYLTVDPTKTYVVSYKGANCSFIGLTSSDWSTVFRYQNDGINTVTVTGADYWYFSPTDSTTKTTYEIHNLSVLEATVETPEYATIRVGSDPVTSVDASSCDIYLKI